MKEDKIDPNSASQNAFVLLVITILLTVLTMNAPYPASGNHGNIIYLVTPPLIALLTFIVYMISRLFTKSRNWIITLLGIILNTIISLKLFLEA